MNNGEIYPARYYSALSPTWFTWNKFTAYDIVHHIHSNPQFDGQNVWFWLNHPIQYFQIAGLVVQIDSVAEGKYTLLTIDDGSGVNMEVKIERKSEKRQLDETDRENSLVEGVDVYIDMGLPLVLLDGKKIEVGEVLFVKGSLTTFRQERQLVATRLIRPKDTNQEAVWWSYMADAKRKVLSKPWVITEEQKAEVDKVLKRQELESKRAEKRDSRKTLHRREREEQHAAKVEAERSLQEEQMNKHALEGSNILPRPWD